MKKIIIATNNAGKFKEIHHYLKNFDLEIISQATLKITEVAEIGKTFIENAIIKARHVSHITGCAALADDSGLVIDALNGLPGIYSARYSGSHGNDQANIDKVLYEMRNISESNRKAHFYCAMVLLRHVDDPAPIISLAAWHGTILLKPKGTGGFGYDPIFYVPTHQCSAAELELTIKNQLSHRGQALQQLQKQLHEFI